MKEKLKEAIDLFEEVMIYGTERVMKSMDLPLWQEYSPEQIQVLKILSAHGKATSAQLADFQGVHKSAISNRIKKLEEKGLISLESDEHDRRSKVISLTEQGKQVVQISDEALYENIEKLFLGKVDEQELDEFLSIFRKLKDILKIKGM